MTEEIIIDGVNVAGCKYYHYKGCTANNLCKCDSNLNICKNCYYKQLKRLEQKLNELKVFDSARQEVLKEYKKALEEIKNDLKEICKEECDYTKAKFCGDCDCRYGQILTKINEVLNG